MAYIGIVFFVFFFWSFGVSNHSHCRWQRSFNTLLHQMHTCISTTEDLLFSSIFQGVKWFYVRWQYGEARVLLQFIKTIIASIRQKAQQDFLIEYCSIFCLSYIYTNSSIKWMHSEFDCRLLVVLFVHLCVCVSHIEVCGGEHKLGGNRIKKWLNCNAPNIGELFHAVSDRVWAASVATHMNIEIII